MTQKAQVCWYCGSTSLRQMETYSVCSKCGATLCDLPVLGQSPLIQDTRGGGVVRMAHLINRERRAKYDMPGKKLK